MWTSKIMVYIDFSGDRSPFNLREKPNSCLFPYFNHFLYVARSYFNQVDALCIT